MKVVWTLDENFDDKLLRFSNKMSAYTLPIVGKPIAIYMVEALSYLGVTELCIASFRHERGLKELLSNGEKWSIQITYSKFQKTILFYFIKYILGFLIRKVLHQIPSDFFISFLYKTN